MNKKREILSETNTDEDKLKEVESQMTSIILKDQRQRL